MQQLWRLSFITLQMAALLVLAACAGPQREVEANPSPTPTETDEDTKSRRSGTTLQDLQDDQDWRRRSVEELDRLAD